MSDVMAREFPYRQGLPYRAILSEKNGQFYIYQPELNIIATGETLASAYDKFCSIRLDFLHEIERAGLEDELPQVRPVRGARTSMRGTGGGAVAAAGNLSMFIVKLAIVVGLFAFVGVVGLFALERVVTNGVARINNGTAHASLVDLTNNAARHAQAMPADRKDQLRDSVGILAREAKPILDALEAGLAGTAPKAAVPAPSKP